MTVGKWKLKLGCVTGVLGFKLQGWWDESLGEVGVGVGVTKGWWFYSLERSSAMSIRAESCANK